VRTGQVGSDVGIPAITRPIPAAIAVAIRAREVLLVQRHNPPDAGLWAYPGGKIELRETITEAALRELREETGVLGRAVRLLTPFDVFHRARDGQLLRHFILLPVLCDWVSGTPVAASDALDAGWFPIGRLEQCPEILSERVLALANEALALETGRLS
jgi:8-oxo-dGTP diphosphatase